MSLRALGAALALALALSGCGSGSGSGDDGASTATAGGKRPQVIVQAATRGFDAAEVYREAAPGVVTIRSIFGGGARRGLRLRARHRRPHRHQRPRRHRGRRQQPRAGQRIFIEFPDRNIVSAEIVGFDPFADVALLRVEPDGFDLHPLQLGDDADLVVGQPVAAIGSPFGEQQSLSSGIVSATDRSIESLTRFQIDGAIQTDASINPGNSGGPLLDAAARVVGINQQIQTSSGANDGVGFAVPISTVKRSLAQLEEDGEVEYAYIGVTSQSLYPQLARKLDLETDFGGLISEVVPGSPADEAGLRGGDGKLRFQAGSYDTGGDVILAVEGREVVTPDDLAHTISTFQPGETVTLEILRDGQHEQVEVTLGHRPGD